MFSPNQRARIIAVSGLAADTIRRIERGQPVREASRMRFERALREEGITPRVALASTSAPPDSERKECAAG